MNLPRMIYQSRVSEVDYSTKQILAKYDNTPAVQEDLHLPLIVGTIRPVATKLSATILEQETESSLEQKDINRDDATRNLYYMCHGYLHNPAPAIREAAQKVMNLFEDEKLEFINENYSVESSIINSMLTAFEKPEIVEAVAKLPGMEVQVSNLRTTQNDFDTTFLLWKDQKAANIQAPSASDLKKELLPLINEKLLPYLKAMTIVDSDTYKEFTQSVAQIIADNNSTVKKRSSN